MSYYYLYKSEVYSLGEPLNPDCYYISDNESDKDSCYIQISEDRYNELNQELNKPTAPQETTPTDNDIRELRERAYREESDSLFIASEKYKAQGLLDKSEEARQAWLTKVSEIDTRYPYQSDVTLNPSEPIEEPLYQLSDEYLDESQTEIPGMGEICN